MSVESTGSNQEWFVRSPDGKVYGPADRDTLVQWVEEGRIEPAGFVSYDRRTWMPAQLMRELEMNWIVEAEPGKFYGPFNRKMVSRLSSRNEIPSGSVFYRRHDFAVDQDPPPVVVEKIVEKEVRVEVPVEKIVEVEKIIEKEVRVEVPVERIVEVEKIIEKEVRVEVPVEKIVEVERIVEVEPPARKAITAGAVMPAAASQPPAPALGGIFKNIDPGKLAALEAAARRELASAKGSGLSGFFSRRKQ